VGWRRAALFMRHMVHFSRGGDRLAAARLALGDRLAFARADGVASWLGHRWLTGHPATRFQLNNQSFLLLFQWAKVVGNTVIS